MPGLAIAILLAVASTLSMLQPIDLFAAICGFTVFVALTTAGLATNACSSCGKIGPGIAWRTCCQACNDKAQTTENDQLQSCPFAVDPMRIADDG